MKKHFSCRGHWILFLLSLTAIVFRQENYLISPRFWAEEGVVFFSFARSHRFIQALLQPHLGYYSLFANLAAIVAAKLTSLEYAPLATTLIAMFGQCMPLGLVVFGKGIYWQGLPRKTLVLAVIFLAPLSYEVWLNTINSQFYLCLFTFLLLLEPPPQSSPEETNAIPIWLLRVGLLLSGLTGVLSCLLLPLYCLRAIVEKKRELVYWSFILSVCLIIQVIVVINSASSVIDSSIVATMGLDLPVRSGHINLPVLGSILMVKTILLNFLGPLGTAPLARILHGYYVKADLVYYFIGYGSLVAVILFWLGLARKVPKPAQYILPCGFLLLTVPSVAFALVPELGVLIHPYAAQRYFYVPNILVLLMITFAVDFSETDRWSKIADISLLAVLAVSLFCGAAEWRHFESGPGRVYDESWPKWRDEIALWRRDNANPVRIWPAPQWKMVLTP